MTEDALRYRLRRGMPAEVAMTTPMHPGQQKLPKGMKRSVAKPVIDWDRAVRLRKRSVLASEIARELGVAYSTIQVGLYRRLGTAAGGARAR